MPGMAQPLHGPNRLHLNKKDIQPWQERHPAEDMHNTLMSSQAIALPPQNGQVCFERCAGGGLDDTGFLEEVVVHCNHALEIEPTNAKALYRQAQVTSLHLHQMTLLFHQQKNKMCTR
jgi:hypothetical protein